MGCVLPKSRSRCWVLAKMSSNVVTGLRDTANRCKRGLAAEHPKPNMSVGDAWLLQLWNWVVSFGGSIEQPISGRSQVEDYLYVAITQRVSTCFLSIHPHCRLACLLSVGGISSWIFSIKILLPLPPNGHFHLQGISWQTNKPTIP